MGDKKEHVVRDDEALVSEANYAKWTTQQNIANQGRSGGVDGHGSRGASRENLLAVGAQVEEVEVMDLVEDIHVTRVERQVTSEKLVWEKMMSINNVVRLVMWNLRASTRRGVRTCRKIAFIGESANDARCGHEVAVVAEIFDGHVANHEKAKGFLFDDGSSHHSNG